MPHFFNYIPVERVLGEGIKVGHFNDDALGSTLRLRPGGVLNNDEFEFKQIVDSLVR